MDVKSKALLPLLISSSNKNQAWRRPKEAAAAAKAVDAAMKENNPRKDLPLVTGVSDCGLSSDDAFTHCIGFGRSPLSRE